MRELEKRLIKIEEKVSKNNAIDSEKLQKFMKSGLFSIACLVHKKEFKRELTDEEKLAIALELYESET